MIPSSAIGLVSGDLHSVASHETVCDRRFCLAVSVATAKFMTDSVYFTDSLDTLVNRFTCFSTPTEAYILKVNLSITYEPLYDFARGFACLIRSQVKIALRNSGIEQTHRISR